MLDCEIFEVFDSKYLAVRKVFMDSHSIIITGFMGTGKTSVARELARLLKIDHYDTDLIIQEKAKKSISEIFERDGEDFFRKLEADVFNSLNQLNNCVISTGGGTFLYDSNYMDLKEHNFIIALDAHFDTIWKRISSDKERPFLLKGKNWLHELKKARTSAYDFVDFRIFTDTLSVEEVADILYQQINRLEKIVSFANNKKNVRSLYLPFLTSSYPIDFFIGARQYFARILRGIYSKEKKCALITNTTIAGLYKDSILNLLEEEGLQVTIFEVEDSESVKNLRQAEELLYSFLEFNLERRHPIIALGGGVVGDLAGFVSSIYLRGVPFIQLPTTLLAQVDSSVGGKTAVNTPYGKNLIGTFYQPSYVCMDMEFLRTLKESDYLSGMAEVIKYGAIRDPYFFDYLDKHAEHVLLRDEQVLETIVYRSCLNKAEVVILDEKESNERMLLNFGHTLGHVFETLANYRGIKHGEAVAIGMVFAAFLSFKESYCSYDTYTKLTKLLVKYRLPVSFLEHSVDDCMSVMLKDKKVTDGQIQFIVLEHIGSAKIKKLDYSVIRKNLILFLQDKNLS